MILRGGLKTKGALIAALLVGLNLLGLALTSAGAAEPKIEVNVNRTRVNEGDTILMEVTLEGLQGNAKPQIPPSQGFSYYETGSSSNVSWVNGKVSSSKVYTYQLVTRKAGKYIIGPISASSRGRSVRAAPVEIEVLPTVATQSGGSTSGQEQVGADQELNQVPAASRDTGLFARLEVDNLNPYQDEQIVLRFKMYQRHDVQLSEIGEYEAPSTQGFWREDLGSQSDYRVRIEGELYHVREIAYALFPIRAGEIEIGAASVICLVPGSRNGRRSIIDFSLFNRQQVPLRSNSVIVKVKPLPETERTSAFTGSVGLYTIEAAFDQTQATQGEPLTLNVTIKGTGHIQTIGAPAWPEWTDMRVFDSGEVSSDSRQNDLVVGSKTFTQVLIPNRVGTINIAPMEYQFFNPSAGQYQTVSSAPLAIEVLPAKATPSGFGNEEILPLGEDILYIRSDLISRLERSGDRRLTLSWLIHLIPFGLLGAGLWLRGRRRNMERNPALARRSRAFRLAKSALIGIDPAAGGVKVAGEIAIVTESYLTAWLDQGVRGMRRQSLEEALLDADLPGPLVTEVMNLLLWADEVRFGAGDGGDVSSKPDSALELISRLEEGFRNTKLKAGL